MPGELHPAEVLLHLGVQEVLVDGREFGRELLVQEVKYPLISAHPLTLTGCNLRQATTRRTAGKFGQGVRRRAHRPGQRAPGVTPAHGARGATDLTAPRCH